MDDETVGPIYARMLGEKREVFLARMLLLVLGKLVEKDTDQLYLDVYDALKHHAEKSARKGRRRPGGS